MKSVLRYPGGKSRMLKYLRPLLTAMLAEESAYYEPFVGGGSVAMEVARQFPKIQLVINDKDPLIYSFWKTICGPLAETEELIQRLQVKPTIALWQAIRNSQPATHAERAFKAVFLNRTSFNGMLHGSTPIGGMKQLGKKGSSRVWLLDCQYHPVELARLIREYRALLLGRTLVTGIDGTAFMTQYADQAHFVDPPYFIEDKPTKSLYGVMMTRQEHTALAAIMAQTRRWILTYDFSDNVAKSLYWGNDMQVMPVKYSSTTSATSHWKKDAEIVAYKGFNLAPAPTKPAESKTRSYRKSSKQ